MHPNPNFRKETEERNIAFARERGFGTLAINSTNGPLLSHVPFLLMEDNKSAELHLVRSNPILRSLSQPQDAVISILGGDSYISPDWYFVDDQVPTWNYIAVHIRGSISLLPEDEIHGVLDRLSASMEERLLPKKPWASSKMDQEVYKKMLRQIVPVKMEISEINGTWKLSQNKPDEVRLAAAKGVAENGVGSELELLSNLMRDAAN
jgi:transcriptional regulator